MNTVLTEKSPREGTTYRDITAQSYLQAQSHENAAASGYTGHQALVLLAFLTAYCDTMAYTSTATA